MKESGALATKGQWPLNRGPAMGRSQSQGREEVPPAVGLSRASGYRGKVGCES